MNITPKEERNCYSKFSVWLPRQVRSQSISDDVTPLVPGLEGFNGSRAGL